MNPRDRMTVGDMRFCRFLIADHHGRRPVRRRTGLVGADRVPQHRGLHHLLAIFEALPVEATLTIIGSAHEEWRAYFEKRLSSMSRPVTYLQTVPSLAIEAHFAEADVFVFPSRAIRSPNGAWMLRERWHAIPKESREGFVPAAPDFVIELRSTSDRRSDLEAKMHEYQAAGVRLGWLIDPIERCVLVYRQHQPMVSVAHPPRLDGSPVLPGFVLELDDVW